MNAEVSKPICWDLALERMGEFKAIIGISIIMAM